MCGLRFLLMFRKSLLQVWRVCGVRFCGSSVLVLLYKILIPVYSKGLSACLRVTLYCWVFLVERVNALVPSNPSRVGFWRLGQVCGFGFPSVLSLYTGYGYIVCW